MEDRKRQKPWQRWEMDEKLEGLSIEMRNKKEPEHGISGI